MQIIQAVHFLHQECGIAHLDIKLENIVADGNFTLKLIDFAFCEPINQKISICKGTDIYLAPEILAHSSKNWLSETPPPYDCEKADIFSLGVLLFILFFGINPYQSNSHIDPNFPFLSSGCIETAEEYFCSHPYTSRCNALNLIPTSLKALLVKMLDAVPDRRPSL